MSDFEKWFVTQDFYTNMRFIHGDALFHKDSDVYRILPVQMVYQGWSVQRQRSKDELIALIEDQQKRIDETITQVNKYRNIGLPMLNPLLDDIEKALRGEHE